MLCYIQYADSVAPGQAMHLQSDLRTTLSFYLLNSYNDVTVNSKALSDLHLHSMEGLIEEMLSQEPPILYLRDELMIRLVIRFRRCSNLSEATLFTYP